MESIGSPLRAMTGTIKNALHKVVSNLSFLKTDTVPNNSIHESHFKIQEQNKNPPPKTTNYVTIRGIHSLVPVGFTGNLLDYTNVILNHLAVMENLSRDVIEPANNLILKYIGRPESLVNISNQDANTIKFHTDMNEDFKKDMNRFYDSKRSHQTQPIGTLIKSIGEYNELIATLNTGTKPWMSNDKWTSRIHKSYKEFQKSIDLLMVRIEQKPDVYRLNKLSAEKVATIISRVAVEIELASAMLAYLDQLMMAVVTLGIRLTNLSEQD